MKKPLFFPLILLLDYALFAQGLPADRFIKWEPGVRGGIPAVHVVANVRDYGAVADGKTDDAAAFQKTIDAVQGEGAVLVPAGSYLLRAELALKSGVVLRGEGMDKTHLFFDMPQEKGRAAIKMMGWWEKVGEIPIVAGAVAGSRRLTLDKNYGLSTQFIWLYCDNDAALLYTKPEWNQGWAKNSVGQIVKITAAQGNVIQVDTPLRLDYKPELKPHLKVMVPLLRAGVEGLHIKRRDDTEGYIIHIVDAVNCWVKDCHLEYCSRAHAWVRRSRWLTIEGNYMHHAYDYGGGGHGYGVVLAESTSDCLVTNNIFRHLRHSMLLQKGANGNVLSYNYSRELANNLCDISVHGHYSYMNLFEGNVVQYIQLADFWGPTGPLTTLFRNRVETLHIRVRDHSHRSNIIGNTLLEGEIRVEDNVKDSLIEGNFYKEMTWWNDLPRGTTFPASLYLFAPPSFWGDRPWPCVGADVDGKRLDRIPAQDRWLLRRSAVK